VDVDLRVRKGHSYELEHLLHAWIHAAQIREAHGRRRVSLGHVICAEATAFAALFAACRS